MKNHITNLVIQEKNINKLLKEFIDEYSEVYSGLDLQGQMTMSEIKDEIYRNWLFSALISDTYVSPNYIFNNIIQSKFPGNYAVLPKINILNPLKDNIYFEKDVIVYSEEDHPIYNDIELIMNSTNPTLILGEGDTYVLSGGAEIIRELTFNSSYYLSYLIEVCLKLKLLKEIKAIKCKCFQKTERDREFFTLSNDKKFKKIFTVSLEIAKEHMSTLPNLNMATKMDYLSEFLNNDIDEENYKRYINEIVPFANDFVSNINEFTDDEKIIETIKFTELIMGEDVGTFIMGTEIRTYLDIYFISVFGYYLGILQPTYIGPFILNENIHNIVTAESDFEKVSNLFNIEVGHDLSKFGEYILKKYGYKIKKEGYSKFSINDFLPTLRMAKREKQEICKEFKMYKEVYGDDRNGGMIHEIMNTLSGDSEYSKSFLVIQNHLNQFIEYLFNIKGLKEGTVINHAKNMEIFLADFLMYKNDEDLRKINSKLIDNYLGDWFIRTMATSATSIKEQIRTLGQYIAFLGQKGIMSSEEITNIKELIRDKEKYICKFREFLS